jgi:acyl-coenzyme A synthetase/AMP-(fatty) acid ligase
LDNIFYKDANTCLSYDELLDSLNKSQVFYEVYYASSYSDFVVNVLLGIIEHHSFILTDYIFGKGENSKPLFVKPIINTKEDLIQLIKKSKAEVGIYSSGSEGPPKLIFQSIQRLLQSVRVSEDYNDSNWGFTYHPAHSAGIQFLIQVICNGATLVNLRDLKSDALKSFIKESQVQYLSATPTFYRLLAPYDQPLPSIISITLNGEKSTQKLIDDIKSLCPNARIRNIYGSTEAGPLMSSDSEVFIIPLRLIDKLKIINSELFFHQSIISKSVINIEWYPSGDLVEIIEDNPLKIRFISRKSRIINVAGHNVNPQQVEEYLLQLHGILDARVYGRANKITDFIIVAEIIYSDDVSYTEKDIISYLKNYLPIYKIPRVIKFVKNIEIGRTGKKSL